MLTDMYAMHECFWTL